MSPDAPARYLIFVSSSITVECACVMFTGIDATRRFDPQTGVSLSVPIGSPIPAFRAASTGGEIDSADLKGRKLVLYFYPKDNTPGCTRQGADFRDRHDDFVQAGAVVLGVSRDSLKLHANFKTKLQFPFELVSDADEALCRFLRQKVIWALVVEPRGIEPASGQEDEHGLPDFARGAKTPWIEVHRAAGCPLRTLAEDLLKAERIVANYLAPNPAR